MLEEMRGAIGRVSLRPAAGIYPNAHGGGLGPRRVLGRDLQPQSAPVRCPAWKHVYREAIAQCGTFGGGAMVDRRSKGPPQRLDGPRQGGAIAQTPCEVSGYQPRSHCRKGDGEWRRRIVVVVWVERWVSFAGRIELWLCSRIRVRAGNFPGFSHPRHRMRYTIAS